MKAKIFKVPSFSDPNKQQTIRQLFPSGEFKCSCQDFIFKENRMKKQGLVPKCDHIRRHLHQRMKIHGRKKK